MKIELSQVSKHFASFSALKGVYFTVRSGELLALLGPSGSGKTTLLRIIAGLETPDEGQVLFDGVDGAHRSLRERRVGFVFQHYALFRHMTVFDNVAFGLRVRPKAARPSKSEIQDRVMALLKLVQLDALAGRYPAQLSGGQRQRVALSRALAVEPEVLLLDEPFGALDANVRKDLRRWLRRLHDEIHLTSVFVTHDQEEALEVADRVAIMNEGVLVQAGTPEEIYHKPASPFVYRFLGDVNLFHARIEDGRTLLDLEMPGSPEAAGASVFVRPHLIDVSTHSDGQEHLRAKVSHIHSAGPQVKLELVTAAGEQVNVTISQERYRELNLQKDTELFVRAKEMQVFVEDYVI